MTATLIKFNDNCAVNTLNSIQVLNVIGIKKINYNWTSPSREHLISKKTIVKYTFTEA